MAKYDVLDTTAQRVIVIKRRNWTQNESSFNQHTPKILQVDCRRQKDD